MAISADEVVVQRALTGETGELLGEVVLLAVERFVGLVDGFFNLFNFGCFQGLLAEQTHSSDQRITYNYYKNLKLQIRQMGSSNSVKLDVASLNYAGIANSPFEFYSGTGKQREELRALSAVFQELAKQEFNLKEIDSGFEWGIKNIDKIMQRERYCPIYRQDAGIIHGRVLTRGRFEQKWTEEFNKNIHYVKFKQEPSEEEVERCKRYDYLTFKSIVEFVYNFRVKQNSKPQISLLDRDPNDEARKNKKVRLERKELVIAYEQFLEEHFSKKFLKHTTKLNAVKKLVSSKDVVFLQDVSDELINSLKNEGCINIISYPCKDCAVLVKQNDLKFTTLFDERKIFDHYKNSEGEVDKQLKDLISTDKFMYDEKKHTTSVCFLDNFLFISLHLSRPKKGEWPIVVKFMTHLLELKAKYPSLHIIGGGDFNRVIYDIPEGSHRDLIHDFFSRFHFYPERLGKNSEYKDTTRKKRTWLQSQRNKADVEDKMCRDFLFSDLPMKEVRIELLGGKLDTATENNLLTNEHPFDHYIVSGSLSFNKR